VVDQNYGDAPAAVQPQVSLAISGRLVASYVTGDTSNTNSAAYIQEFDYTPDGNGGVRVTPAGATINVGSGAAVVPVATTEGGFVAVTDFDSTYQYDTFGTGYLYFQRFNDNGTAEDSPQLVIPNSGAGALAGAAVDQDGGVYVAWYDGGTGYYGTGGDLFMSKFSSDDTAAFGQLKVTPLNPDAYVVGGSTSMAVGPDGSTLFGWDVGSSSVAARHYDPIVSQSTQTSYFQTPNTSGGVSVTSTATVTTSGTLWEYQVTNDVSTWNNGVNYPAVGQFSLGGNPEVIQDAYNSIGWQLSSTGLSWSAPSAGYDLGYEETADFSFTAPSAYAIQPTSATAVAGTITESGSVLGPGLTGPETDTLTAGTLGGQISVVSSLIPADGNMVWDYQVTNNSSTSIGELAFLDEPVNASNFTSSLGWTLNDADTGWAAASTDPLLTAGQTADFEFTTPPVAVGHVAVRATSSDGTNAAEGTVLAPSDPPTDTTTNTSTLTDGSGGSVTVTATATTFASYVFWQYSVTNNGTASLGQFSLSSQPTGIADEWNSLGWAVDGTGTNWSAGTGGQLLAHGQTATFTFTTTWAYSAQPTPAHAGGGGWSTTASGTVNGPQPRVIDYETQTSMLTYTDFNGIQQIQVVSSATQYADHILWQYSATNISFVGTGYFGTFGFWNFSVGTPDDAVSDQTDSPDWPNGSGAVWDSRFNSGPPTPVAISGQAYFSYTTAVVPIGEVHAMAGDDKDGAGGCVLGAPPPTAGINGPNAVPGNSQYTYTVTFPRPAVTSQVNAGTWIDLGQGAQFKGSGLIVQAGQPNVALGAWATFAFKNQPSNVTIWLTGLRVPGQRVVPQMEAVDIVQVIVAPPPAPLKAFDPATRLNDVLGVTPVDYIVDGVNPPPTTGRDGKEVNSQDLSQDPIQLGLRFNAQVTLIGPGPTKAAGVNHITVGFVQHATQTAASIEQGGKSAYYTMVNHKWYLDDSGSIWYATFESAILHGTSANGGTDGLIQSNDSPAALWPLLGQGNATVVENSAFKLDVAAYTDSPVADSDDLNSYWAEATANWSFNASGKLGPAPNFAFAPTGIPVTAPTSWKIVTAPAREEITASMNDVGKTMSWNTK
jgi:hypothetical protein